MSVTERVDAIRRILVALDASQTSLAALEAAVELASAQAAELHGLYVEDAALVRLASLPSIREVGYTSGTRRDVEAPTMQRSLRAVASQARRALAETAQRAQVPWEFSVGRGSVAAELLRAALDADLSVLGRASRPSGARLRLGSTAREILEEAPGSVLVLRHGLRPRSRLVALFEDTPASHRALAIATELSQRLEAPLTIAVTASDEVASDRLGQAAAQAVTEREVVPHLVRLPPGDLRSLIRILRTTHADLLVVGAPSDALAAESVLQLADELDLSFFIVRG